jgi:hypothetical protein
MSRGVVKNDELSAHLGHVDIVFVLPATLLNIAMPSFAMAARLRKHDFRQSHGVHLLILVLLISLAGCGAKSDRLEITGTVTLDGVPLDEGSIRFTSMGEKKISSGALVQQGEYHIPRETGLTVGAYHVEITAPDTKAPPVMVQVVPGKRGMPTQPDRIPPEYNVNSKQKVDVSEDGDNHFVFDIVTSRP